MNKSQAAETSSVVRLKTTCSTELPFSFSALIAGPYALVFRAAAKIVGFVVTPLTL
jgi:hypothetical protein